MFPLLSVQWLEPGVLLVSETQLADEGTVSEAVNRSGIGLSRLL